MYGSARIARPFSSGFPMPHSASAKKRHRQNLRDRERHRAVKSTLKNSIRKVLDASVSGDAAAAKESLRGLAKTVDQAAAKGTIHRNRAARIKSRLSARLLVASKGTAPVAPTKARKAPKA
jgi:small subunit ribosomal protein S20